MANPAEAINAAFAEIHAEQREEANLRRRQEIRAELKRLIGDADSVETTPEMAALFNELEALRDLDS